jgi:uncharacterized membrane protein YphA (DoxX/SURF4 family)
MIIGFATTAAAAVLSLGTIGVAYGWIPWSPLDPVDFSVTTVFLVSMCVAIALMGPGSVSVDARLRGRREIVIPPDVQRSGDDSGR